MFRIVLIIGFLAVVAFFVWSGWPKTKDGRLDDGADARVSVAALSVRTGTESWSAKGRDGQLRFTLNPADAGVADGLNGRAISKSENKRSGA